MKLLSNKITGNTLTAAEWDELALEIERIITANGISLSSGDLNQLGKGISEYVANANFYASTGGPVAYTLTQSVFKNPASLTDGMSARFRPNANNSGSVTVNVAGLGVKAVLSEAGTALTGGELQTNRDAFIRYDGSDWLLSNATATGQLESERGVIVGLQMSNEAGDLDHDIEVTVGNCRDAVDSQTILISSSLIKQINADWAAGTNVGGIASAVSPVAADTWYHVFAIRKNNGLTDIGFDSNIAAVNLLTDSGYDQYRRIGSVLTDGSANILPFIQLGDDFFWQDMANDYNTTDPGVAQVDVALSTPLGVRCIAQVVAVIRDVGPTGAASFMLVSPVGSSTAPSATFYNLKLMESSFEDERTTDGANTMDIVTDLLSQVTFEISLSDAGISVLLHTQSYRDDRGKSS